MIKSLENSLSRNNTEAAATSVSSFLIFTFLLSYIPPGNISIGTVVLGFPRLFLVLSFVPALVIYLYNSKIRKSIVDYLVFAHSFWLVLSILVNHGTSQIEFAGLQLVETLGAYILGRTLLYSLAAYRYFWRTFATLSLIILPIALVELLTEQFILHELFASFINTFDNATARYPRRLGFDRVQGNFEHPILFGIFWGFGCAHYLSVFKTLAAKTLFILVAGCLVAMSLSSGAYLALLLQIMLFTWGYLTGGRWRLLVLIAALALLVTEIVSDRSALVAISTRLAFSAQTAYWRVHIFDFGMQNVFDNPFFGLGLNDWVRPHWLTNSVDNQWLLIAMRNGMPAFFLLISAIGLMFFKLIRRMDFSDDQKEYRVNFLISFTCLMLALGTVAVWSGTQAFFWVIFSMGTNLATLETRNHSKEELESKKILKKNDDSKSKYSRFS